MRLLEGAKESSEKAVLQIIAQASAIGLHLAIAIGREVMSNKGSAREVEQLEAR